MKKKNGKRKGSILIEVIISIMILLIVTASIINVNIGSNRAIKSRILNQYVNNYLEILSNEIKYNLSRDDIENLFSDKDQLYIRYDNDYVSNIINENIISLIEDSSIAEDKVILKKLKQDDKNIEFELNADIKIGEIDASCNKKFEKSWWMDEI